MEIETGNWKVGRVRSGSSARVLAGLGGMFFLLGMSSGLYVPALTNILTAEGLDTRLVQWAWLAGPVAALLSPVCVGALADNRFAAERVMGWSGVASALLLGGAFAALDADLSPWWFVALLLGVITAAAGGMAGKPDVKEVHDRRKVV